MTHSSALLHCFADEKLSLGCQSDLIAKFINNSLQLVETGSLSYGKLDKPCGTIPVT